MMYELKKTEFDDHFEFYGSYIISYGIPFPAAPDDPIRQLITNLKEITEPDDYVVLVRPKSGCNSISVTIPEEKDGHPVRGVVIFQEPPSAFAEYEDIKLKYLYIPASVRHLHIETNPSPITDMISECRVEISPDNPYYQVYENSIYSKDMTKLYYICSPGEYFEPPASVKRIKKGAGGSLKGLRRLVIPENVSIIEESAFEYCIDLEEAEIFSQIIEDKAFQNCQSLVSVRLPRCKTIGQFAFALCEKLSLAEIPCAEVIQYGAFRFCTALEEIALPDTLLNIGNYAFEGTEIKELTVPPSVQRIGKYILNNPDRQNEPRDATLNVYANLNSLNSGDGGLPHIFDGCPADGGTLLALLSPETNERVSELVILEEFDEDVELYTENSIDLDAYDNLFVNGTIFMDTKNRLRAAQTRLRWLDKNDGKKREQFESYISEAAVVIVIQAINAFPDKATDDDLTDNKYTDLLFDKTFTILIDIAAKRGKPEVTAILLEKQHKKREREKNDQ